MNTTQNCDNLDDKIKLLKENYCKRINTIKDKANYIIHLLENDENILDEKEYITKKIMELAHLSKELQFMHFLELKYYEHLQKEKD